MRKYELYLEDILIAIEKIERYSSEDLDDNEMAFEAILRNLEIIGEATKNIPSEIKIKIKGTDWRKIAGLRDILSHAYFAVDKDIINEIILYKLPELKSAIEKFNNERK